MLDAPIRIVQNAMDQTQMTVKNVLMDITPIMEFVLLVIPAAIFAKELDNVRNAKPAIISMAPLVLLVVQANSHLLALLIHQSVLIVLTQTARNVAELFQAHVPLVKLAIMKVVESVNHVMILHAHPALVLVMKNACLVKLVIMSLKRLVTLVMMITAMTAKRLEQVNVLPVILATMSPTPSVWLVKIKAVELVMELELPNVKNVKPAIISQVNHQPLVPLVALVNTLLLPQLRLAIVLIVLIRVAMHALELKQECVPLVELTTIWILKQILVLLVTMGCIQLSVQLNVLYVMMRIAMLVVALISTNAQSVQSTTTLIAQPRPVLVVVMVITLQQAPPLLKIALHVIIPIAFLVVLRVVTSVTNVSLVMPLLMDPVVSATTRTVKLVQAHLQEAVPLVNSDSLFLMALAQLVRQRSSSNSLQQSDMK